MSSLPDSFLRRMEKKDKPPGNAGLTTAEASEKWARGKEKELQNQCANLCRQRGLFFLQAPFGRKNGLPKGWPDFCVWLPIRTCGGFVEYSYTLLIECKVEGAHCSDDQISLHNDFFAKTGCVVSVVYNLEQFRSLIS